MVITVFSTIITPQKQIKGKMREIILNKQHYKRLYNFHVIITGDVSDLPALLVRFNDQIANVDLNFYLNLDFDPCVGYRISYYNETEHKMIISFKSYGKPGDLSVILVNNDVNQIVAYMIVEAEIAMG